MQWTLDAVFGKGEDNANQSWSTNWDAQGYVDDVGIWWSGDEWSQWGNGEGEDVNALDKGKGGKGKGASC